MSIALMTAIWEMDFTPVDKLVLLALADWANEDGKCWPSIAKIAAKTGCGERTVQRALREAETRGILARHENKGKGCVYTINPRHCVTPATKSPPSDRRQTPATVAPNTSGTTIVEEAKASPTKRAKPKKSDPFVLPDWIPTDAWTRFVAMRKSIGKPMSNDAMGLAVTKLNELAEDGHPPGAVLDQSTFSSWRGLFPIKDQNHGQPKQSPNRGGSTRDAAQLALARMGYG